MQIISGSARGQRLRSPRGSTLRPTSNRVRQPLFSMLEAQNTSWERVLDLYAGTGALGIEALSRGAAWVDFVDTDFRACAAIRASLLRLGLAEQARVYPLSAKQACQRLAGPYTLAFLDPPYQAAGIPELIESVAEGPLLAEGALLAWEHSSRVAPPTIIASLRLVRARRYGDTSLTLYRKEV